jgi:hypothetical protein
MVVHCWEDIEIDGVSHSCMLEDGHAGPHEWTRDDEIMVSFAPFDDEKKVD